MSSLTAPSLRAFLAQRARALDQGWGFPTQVLAAHVPLEADPSSTLALNVRARFLKDRLVKCTISACGGAVRLSIDTRRFAVEIYSPIDEADDTASLSQWQLETLERIQLGDEYELCFEAVDNRVVDKVLRDIQYLASMRWCRRCDRGGFVPMLPENVCPSCAVTLSDHDMREVQCGICGSHEYAVGMDACGRCAMMWCVACNAKMKGVACPYCRNALKRKPGA